MYKGLFHVHTEFSDGNLSIAEIVETCQKQEYDFVYVTDHSRYLSPKKFKNMVKKCRDNSNSNFLCIPGMEIDTIDGLHILALGIDFFVEKGKASRISEFLMENEIPSILAHPPTRARYDFMEFNAIETWNAARNKLAPLKSDKFKNNSLSYKFEIGGVDFHRKEQINDLILNINAKNLNIKSLNKAIKTGDYTYGNKWIEVDSFGNTNSYYKTKLLRFFDGIEYMKKAY